MEKLLDRPRAFEESQTRYVLALEAQKRAQIIVISNAQRKLVSNFQKKLKASAEISETHTKWVLDVKAAQQKTAKGIESSGFDARKLKTRSSHRKARPKTTGANKRDGLYLKGTISPFVNISQGAACFNHLKPKETMVETLKRKALQTVEVGTHSSKDSEMERTTNVKDPHSYRYMFDDSRSPPVHRHSLHNTATIPKGCTGAINAIHKRMYLEGDPNSFGTGNLELQNVQKLVADDNFNGHDNLIKRIHLPEFLPKIGNERAQGSENSGKLYEPRKWILRKSKSCDVNKLRKGGLLSTGNNVALEVRDRALQDVTSSRMDDVGCVNDCIKARPVVETLSSNESTSMSSIRSRGTAYRSNGLTSRRSRSGSARTNPERTMSYEFRTWISNIKRDVEKIHSCTEDPPIDRNTRVLAYKNSWISENSSTSSIALEKFGEIFRDLYITEASSDEDSEFEHRKELVDVSSLYATAASMDSKLDEDQNWHKRDPRNKKLRPPILL